VDTLGHLPSIRRGHSCNVASDSKHSLVFFGGIYGYAKMLNDLHLLDLKTMKWEKPLTGGKTPDPRAWHCSCLNRNYLFIYGGMLKNGSVSNEVFVLDLI